MPGYAELRARSCFSFLHGASQPAELVEASAALGHAALAITDLATLAGAPRAHVAAKQHSLKLIIGAEVQPVTPSGSAGFAGAPPVVLLATDRESYGRLCRLITIGRRRAPKGECYISLSDILQYSRGLLAIAAPDAAHLEGARLPSILSTLREGFGDRLYCSIESHASQRDAHLCAAALSIAKNINIPAVVTHNIQFHNSDRKELHDVFTAIRTGTTVATAAHRLLPSASWAPRAAAEQYTIFRRLLGAEGEGAVARTLEIAARCTFSLDELRYEYPDEVVPPGSTPSSWLRNITYHGAADRYGAQIPEKVILQIEHELELISDLHYESYFLTVYDIVQFARSRGILCQGRGSAANSAVCFCLGVTSVDPARAQLLFERFISRERNEPPDIDIDFEHERREEVMQYIYNKYGRERAGIAAEVICYRGRSAVRDVGKALGLSLDQVDRLAKTLDHYGTGDIKNRHLAEAGLSPSDPNIARVMRITREISDFPRHLSQHVGGFVISRGPLCEMVPIENAAMADRTVVEWDKDDLDALGLMKVDLLSLGMLTATRKCLDLVAEHHKQQFTLATIPAEDPQTYQMLCEADAVGVFQVESRAQRAMLPRLRPACFYDLVIEVAIVRPGPIQGGMVHPYLRRRSGKEEYDINEYPALSVILERTCGVPLFQEQVMRIAVVAASFTPGEADQLRRAMGAWKRRGILEGFYNKFIDGMLNNNYPREFAERVFAQIRGFGEYGFPESHAASFALIAYNTAWLKRHYPAAFTAALLNSQPMGFYAPAQLVRDAIEHGVEVRPVDIHYSSWDATLELDPQFPIRGAADNAPPAEWGAGGPAIRLGFRSVKNLERAAAERIVKSRETGGPYNSIESCVVRAALDKCAIRALTDADAFQSLQINRRGALWTALAIAERPPLFPNCDIQETPPPLPPMEELEEVMRDYSSVGLSLKNHPMAFYRAELAARGVRPARDIVKIKDGARMAAAGIVLHRQRPETASGVVFVTLEDETGVVNLIIMSDVFDRYRTAARTSVAMIAQGIVEKSSGVIHLKATKIASLDDLQSFPAHSRDFH